MEPAGIYIHIPYCLHKCGYCDFNSHEIDTAEMERYVKALIREIKHNAPALKDREVATLFFGGGTPTTLPAGDHIRILKACRKHFNIRDDAEITTEANPSTVETENLKCLRGAGINRISIGAQSFDPEELKRLDRVHSAEEIPLTVERARKAGFDNLSLDLMFALPGQSLESWDHNLERALALQPEHLSTYNLTIEPGTAFHTQQSKGRLKMPPEDTQLEFYQHTLTKMKSAGFVHYEISNFARPGFESRHNTLYWENRDVLGVGAGASSYVNGVRSKNFNLPSHYIHAITTKNSAVQTQEKLEPRQSMGETLMLGLRRLEGVDIPKFEQRFQVSFDREFGDTLSKLRNQDLIALDRDRVALSPKGLFVADSVILEFMA